MAVRERAWPVSLDSGQAVVALEQGACTSIFPRCGAPWMGSGAASRPEKGSRTRRLARRMGDLMAGLWCWWKRRVGTDPGTPTC